MGLYSSFEDTQRISFSDNHVKFIAPPRCQDQEEPWCRSSLCPERWFQFPPYHLIQYDGLWRKVKSKPVPCYVTNHEARQQCLVTVEGCWNSSMKLLRNRQQGQFLWSGLLWNFWRLFRMKRTKTVHNVTLKDFRKKIEKWYQLLVYTSLLYTLTHFVNPFKQPSGTQGQLQPLFDNLYVGYHRFMTYLKQKPFWIIKE